MKTAQATTAALEQRDNQLPREPLGRLSPIEATHKEVAESPAHRRIREQLQDQMYEASKMREWFEREIRAALPPSFPFEQILEFADWKARELHLRDRYESMGFNERLG